MSPCRLPSKKTHPLHVSRDSTQSIPKMGSLMCFPHLKLPKVWSCIWRYARSKIQLKHCKTTHRSWLHGKKQLDDTAKLRVKSFQDGNLWALPKHQPHDYPSSTGSSGIPSTPCSWTQICCKLNLGCSIPRDCVCRKEQALNMWNQVTIYQYSLGAFNLQLVVSQAMLRWHTDDAHLSSCRIKVPKNSAVESFVFCGARFWFLQTFPPWFSGNQLKLAKETSLSLNHPSFAL